MTTVISVLVGGGGVALLVLAVAWRLDRLDDRCDRLADQLRNHSSADTDLVARLQQAQREELVRDRLHNLEMAYRTHRHQNFAGELGTGIGGPARSNFDHRLPDGRDTGRGLGRPTQGPEAGLGPHKPTAEGSTPSPATDTTAGDPGAEVE